MKFLFPILLFFASCSTLHKVVHNEKKTVDSTAAVTKDTSSSSSEISKSDDLTIHGLDITVNYNKADSALKRAKDSPVQWKPYYVPRGKVTSDPFVRAIQDAIAHTGSPGEISSVTIHIDDLSHASTETNKKDSSSGKTISKITVHSTDQSHDKTVTRTGISWFIWVGGILLLLVLIVVVIYKLNKKYNWWGKILP